MSTALIHVNRQFIAKNTKDGLNRPIYTIKRNGKTRYAREVQILGPSKLVYDGRQLKCGGRAWVDTDSEIILIDELSFTQAKEIDGDIT